MANDKQTFEQGYKDGYWSIIPGAPYAIPSYAIPAGKTPYEWGFEIGVQAAKGHPSN